MSLCSEFVIMSVTSRLPKMLVRLLVWTSCVWSMSRPQLHWPMAWTKPRTKCEYRRTSITTSTVHYYYLEYPFIINGSEKGKKLKVHDIWPVFVVPVITLFAVLLCMIWVEVPLISQSWRSRRECLRWSPPTVTPSLEERTLTSISWNTLSRSSRERWIIQVSAVGPLLTVNLWVCILRFHDCLFYLFSLVWIWWKTTWLFRESERLLRRPSVSCLLLCRYTQQASSEHLWTVQREHRNGTWDAAP